jgi:hypothetical protein
VNASSEKEGNVSARGAWPMQSANKIDDVDQRLQDWVGSVLAGASVTLSAPVDEATGPLVGLYLLDLHPSRLAEGPRRLPLQILLRYLVTTCAERLEEAHAMLGSLVFAAMEQPEFEVDLEPVPAELWTAFGVLPRPAFRLRIPLRLVRPQEDVRLVKTPLEVRGAPIVSMDGVLMGPNEIPIANAQVKLPDCQLATRTDSKGRFSFAAVPGGSTVRRFLIRAFGRDFAVDVERRTGDQAPLIIHINPGEF